MNWLISKAQLLFYTRATYNASRIFNSLLTSDVHIRDSHDHIYMLQNCWSVKNLKQIHDHIIMGGCQQNPFVGTRLIGKYIELRTSRMEDARKIFDVLSERDIFLWNMMIQGYAKHGPLKDALNYFAQMKVAGVGVNQFPLAFMLKACSEVKEIKMGEMVHRLVVKSELSMNVFVGNPLITVYGKCGEVSSSRKVFDEMVEKDIVSLNSMLSAYVINDLPNEALELFPVMLGRNNFT